MQPRENSSLRCAVILADEDANGSTLGHSLRRLEKLLPPERIFTAVSRDHLRHPELTQQLSSRPKGTVITQPEIKETGLSILLPLMHLAKRFPKSTVAVFPLDPLIGEEDLFMAYLAHVFCVVEEDPSRLVLLGIEADKAESKYGYIVPDGTDGVPENSDIRRVSRFVEKPEANMARELTLQGALWNTMIMVSRTETLLNLARGVAPKLYESFEPIVTAIGTRNGRQVVEEAHRHMECVNFSQGFLETLQLHNPSCLWVLPVRGASFTKIGYWT